MWAVAAITAAIMWGLTYAFSERMLKAGFAPSFMLALTSFIGVPFYTMIAARNSDIKQQLVLLKNNPKWALISFGTILLYVIATNLVLYAIQQKNATVVSLIEIAYPLFTALFAWMLFREVQLNWGVAAGAALILSGMACVILFAK